MNTTKKLQQAKLDQWAVLCKEQSESGLTVKQWCEQNSYTIHTYNYWKHRLKESYVDSVLPDIVPITPQPPAPLHELHDLGITNSISILLGNTIISLVASTSDEMLYRIITALYHILIVKWIILRMSYHLYAVIKFLLMFNCPQRIFPHF